MDIHETFKCQCHANEHMVAVNVYHWPDDEPDFCLSVTADVHLPWYRRVWVAIKYMFGQPSLSWHDVLLNHEDVVKLDNIISDYMAHKGS
jgi:hypothetical protein